MTGNATIRNVKRIQSDPEVYKWFVMGIVMVGTLMSTLDMSIVNVSIPSIMADFGTNVNDIEWVVTAYMIAFATFMPLTAWFRSRIGYKSLFMGSLFIFVMGSLLCGMAWSLPSLIIARVIQAFGGGAISPTGMAMITEVFEPRERGKAIGIWGMGIILGPAVGPTLGGYLTNTFGWRSIFMVNLPIGIIGFAVALRYLVKDRPHESSRTPFDFWGFLFLSAFLVSFLLGLSKGEEKGWTSTYIAACVIIALLSFIAFIVAEINERNRIIDLSLFKLPVFSICSIIIISRSVILFGSIFLLPIFLQRQMGFDEIQSGLILMPPAVALALILPFAGRLGDKIGPRLPTVAGLIGIGISMFMYRNIDVTMSVFDIIKPSLVRSLGMGFLMAPLMAAAMNAVPRRKAGMASSILNIVMQVGGSTGIAMLTTVLSHRVHFHLSILGASMNIAKSPFHETFMNLVQRAHTLGYNYAQSALVAKTQIMKLIYARATVFAFQDAFIFGSLFAFLPIVLAFKLPGRAVEHTEAEEITTVVESAPPLE